MPAFNEETQLWEQVTDGPLSSANLMFYHFLSPAAKALFGEARIAQIQKEIRESSENPKK